MNHHLEASRPTTIILADKPLSNDLNEIFGQQDLSSLMVAGNTILEHTLMELEDLDIKECIILARHNADQVQSLIGDTRRRGINITVINYSLNKEQVLREYKALSSPNGLLIVELDRLRSRCIEHFLNQSKLSDYSLLEAKCGGKTLGVTLLKANNSDFIINAMPIEIDSIVVNHLSNICEFHQANFDVVANLFPGLEPSVEINSSLGRRQHWASEVHSKVKPDTKNVMIDRHCRVGKGASLESVILNHDVYVARNVRLENTVVMPNAIISAFKPIKNAIINGDRVFHV